MTPRQTRQPTCPFCRKTGSSQPAGSAVDIGQARAERPYICWNCNTHFTIRFRTDNGRAIRKTVTKKGHRP